MPPIVEAVPNVSEGRRGELISSIAEAFGSTPGVILLDVSSDATHNRSVLTAIGEPSALEEASLRLFQSAIDKIDLGMHRGAHPRIGAVDVLPFVPVEGVTMKDCVELARRVGEKVAERFRLPIFLYEEAAVRRDRSDLAAIRKGQFEGLAEKMKAPFWKPDFGPAAPHPTAGAAAVGARIPLIAYNVILGTDRIEVAQAIAKRVRHSGGGLPYVKALGIGLEESGRVQVSMNLTDYRRTPLHLAFEAVRVEAERRGVPVLSSEIVGLAPMDALLSACGYFLKLDACNRDVVLEEKIRQALAKKKLAGG
ncbi:MAG: glutamate formimidoyltransferase [Acidobacteriota bacterium]